MTNAKITPQTIESEEAVLGSILYVPDCLQDVSFLRAEDFYILRNRWIFEAMLALQNEGHAIDNLSVAELLNRQGKLADAGGQAYLTKLMNSVPHGDHAETYGRLVEAAAVRRDLIARLEAIANHAYDGSLTVQEVIAKSEEEILTVAENRFRNENAVSAFDAISSYWDVLEARHEAFKSGELVQVGLPTGFARLDDMNSGWRDGRLVLIAGRPGHGKSTFMLDQARRQAEAGRSVAVFSFEMTVEELTNKFVAALTGINSLKLDAGKLDGREWGSVAKAMKEIAKWQLQIISCNDATVRDIRRNCEITKRGMGLHLVVVDYIQLMMDDDHKHNNNRVQELSAISRGLKKAAMDLDVPFLVGCQLNRAIEGRAEKEPQLSDLRESGSLEQDANEVLFVRPIEENGHTINCYLKKCRNGSTGLFQAHMDREISRFREVGGGQ